MRGVKRHKITYCDYDMQLPICKTGAHNLWLIALTNQKEPLNFAGQRICPTVSGPERISKGNRQPGQSIELQKH